MENLVHIGHVSRVHGYKGQVKISLRTHISLKKTKGLVLFVEFANKPVPFFYESFTEQGEHLIVHFEGLKNEADAQELVGRSILAAKNYIKEETDDLARLNGFKIVDQNNIEIGVVNEVLNYNQYLAKTMVDGKEILLPLNEDTILDIQEKKQIIYLHIPEGLIEFYKSN